MPSDRIDPKLDMQRKRMAKVTIGRNAFIGAGSFILKGVEIGDNAVIGAGSVVTKSVPANEIWAGNPARFIKKINE
jgi:acetyltransferase-like isoleucine patch superfamily enzyme